MIALVLLMVSRITLDVGTMLMVQGLVQYVQLKAARTAEAQVHQTGREAPRAEDGEAIATLRRPPAPPPAEMPAAPGRGAATNESAPFVGTIDPVVREEQEARATLRGDPFFALLVEVQDRARIPFSARDEGLSIAVTCMLHSLTIAVYRVRYQHPTKRASLQSMVDRFCQELEAFEAPSPWQASR